MLRGSPGLMPQRAYEVILMPSQHIGFFKWQELH